jgi:DNA topoisomerase-3
MSYLHIAEKNSIAKEVSNILSDGTRKTGFTRSQYNPVYEFTIDDKQQRFSSVRGHMFEY